MYAVDRDKMEGEECVIYLCMHQASNKQCMMSFFVMIASSAIIISFKGDLARISRTLRYTPLLDDDQEETGEWPV